jgi:hypothetical protein
MKKLNLKTLLIVSLLFSFVGAIMKIMHLKFELLINIFLEIGTISTFLLVILIIASLTKNRSIRV